MAPSPVGDVGTLLARLRAAAGGAPVAFAIDCPIGLPRAYVTRHAREDDFPAFLRNLVNRPDWFRVCDRLDEISAHRPFYPRVSRTKGDVSQSGHIQALGLDDRAVDRKTADRPSGAPLFWTLGPNQSGKAAISAWQQLILPAFAEGVALRIWPFEGDLLALLAPGTTVLAETYPAEAMRHLGIKMGGSKRTPEDRVRLGPALRAAMIRLDAVPDAGMEACLRDGFGPKPDGEDPFDSTLGLLALLNVLAGHRPDGIPNDPWLRRWEGWVLGQTALPLVQPA
jgi:hypothetical protein